MHMENPWGRRKYNNHLSLFPGHDDVPQLDPRGHPLRGRVWSHPTAGAGAGPAHPQCGDLHQTGGEILVLIYLQILKLLSRRPSPATTARCWGRSRARRSSTSSWTPARNTSTSSSERCCSCRWTMTRYSSAEMKKVLLLNEVNVTSVPLHFHFIWRGDIGSRGFQIQPSQHYSFQVRIVNCAKHTQNTQMCFFRFVDAESIMVKDLLEEMEAFSPVGSNILNKTGVCCE